MVTEFLLEDGEKVPEIVNADKCHPWVFVIYFMKGFGEIQTILLGPSFWGPAQCFDIIILNLDSGDGYTTSWIHLMSLNCILKNGWNNFMYVLP